MYAIQLPDDSCRQSRPESTSLSSDTSRLLIRSPAYYTVCHSQLITTRPSLSQPVGVDDCLALPPYDQLPSLWATAGVSYRKSNSRRNLPSNRKAIASVEHGIQHAPVSLAVFSAFVVSCCDFGPLARDRSRDPSAWPSSLARPNPHHRHHHLSPPR